MTLTKQFAAVLGLGGLLGLGGCSSSQVEKTLELTARGIGVANEGIGVATGGHYAYRCTQNGGVINPQGRCVAPGAYGYYPN